MITDSDMAEAMLSALGERLATSGTGVALVVLGGTAMNLRGYVRRPTVDVDVLARLEGAALCHPEPLPEALRRAIAEVALDFQQPSDWMNTVVAAQWIAGLPPGLDGRLDWRSYGALRIGLVGRLDLIAFKLFAAADQTGPNSVHVRDLLALRPSTDELEWASGWVRTQDASPEFPSTIQKVVEYVSAHAR